MSKFDLGPGWREVPGMIMSEHEAAEHVIWREDEHVRLWVREKPVPSLPTNTPPTARVRGRVVNCDSRRARKWLGALHLLPFLGLAVLFIGLWIRSDA